MPRPTSTHEQREAVRLLALSVGVREAARKMGLEENRVMKWSERYQWIQRDLPIQPPTMQTDIVSAVSKAANSLAETLKNAGETTKLDLSRAAQKAAKRFAGMSGEKIINRSDRLLNVTNVAAKIHSWDSNGAHSAVNLNVLSGGRAVVQTVVKQ